MNDKMLSISGIHFRLSNAKSYLSGVRFGLRYGTGKVKYRKGLELSERCSFLVKTLNFVVDRFDPAFERC